MVADYLVKCYRAIMLDTEEEYDELITALTGVLHHEPGNVVALNNRAVAWWETGELAQALHDLSEAIEIGTDATPLVNRAEMLMRLGLHSEALLDYSAAIEIEPANPYLRRGRGHLLHGLGRFAEAVADYDVAIHVQPEFHRTWTDREKAVASTQLDERLEK